MHVRSTAAPCPHPAPADPAGAAPGRRPHVRSTPGAGAGPPSAVLAKGPAGSMPIRCALLTVHPRHRDAGSDWPCRWSFRWHTGPGAMANPARWPGAALGAGGSLDAQPVGRSFGSADVKPAINARAARARACTPVTPVSLKADNAACRCRRKRLGVICIIAPGVTVPRTVALSTAAMGHAV